MPSRRATLALVLVVSGPLACTIRIPSEDHTSTTLASATDPASTSTTDTPTTATPTNATTSTTADSAPTTGSPVDLPPASCETWDDQCPPGSKCVPIPDRNGIFPTKECRDVIESPGARGDPCTSIFSGEDSCDRGLFCWGGRCIVHCEGPERDQYTCPDWSGCAIWNDGTLALCFEICDPFAPNCVEGEECVLAYPTFICREDEGGSDLGLFESCDFLTDCADGLACVLNAAQECEPNKSCCTPICNAGAMEPCPGMGQSCTVLEPSQPFTGHLGFCSVPD